MTMEEKVAALRAENAALRETLGRVEARVAELERRKTPLPPWAKANTPTDRPPTPCKKRVPEQNAGRRRTEPTRIVEHTYGRCPACAYRLQGRSVSWNRQVIEIPEPPVEIIEHRGVKRYCPACQAWRTPRARPALVGAVLGQGRFGVRLVSALGWLRARLRLPLGQIREAAHTLWGLRVSEGGIVESLRRLAVATADERARIAARVRASPAVHADETGWREAGQNGYVRVRATPADDCLYTYDRSRAGAVAQRLLDDCAGVRCTDFYADYNGVLGRKQRCWAHLLRDLHDLKDAHPHNATVRAWAEALSALYRRGQECVPATSPPRSESAPTSSWRITHALPVVIALYLSLIVPSF